MNALIQLVFVVALFCSVEAEVKAPDQILKTLQSGHLGNTRTAP